MSGDKIWRTKRRSVDISTTGFDEMTMGWIREVNRNFVTANRGEPLGRFYTVQNSRVGQMKLALRMGNFVRPIGQFWLGGHLADMVGG